MTNQLLHLLLQGGRFDKAQGFPLESLPALRAVGQLVNCVARDLFFEQQHDRGRVPTGFDAAFCPALVNVARGSAICEVAGWDSVPTAFAPYYNDARTEVWRLLQATTQDAPTLPGWCTHRTRKTLAGVLSMVSDDETLQITIGDTDGRLQPIVLNAKAKARAQQQANRQSATSQEPFSIVGRICRLDNDPWAIGLKVRESERKVLIPLNTALQPQARNAFDQTDHTHRLVLVRGTAERTAEGARKFLVATAIQSIGGSPIASRIRALVALDQDWLGHEGDSQAPTKAFGRAVERQIWDLIEQLAVDRPLLYATPAGGLEALWRMASATTKVVFSPRPFAVQGTWLGLRSRTTSKTAVVGSLTQIGTWIASKTRAETVA